MAATAARTIEVRDASGNVLADGDADVLINDLKVKGTGQASKPGTVIKSIRLTDNPEESDCRHDAIRGLVLRTAVGAQALNLALCCATSGPLH
jgi:protein PhnA